MDNDKRWDAIQKTRELDRNTGVPVPGSLGMAYVMWANNIVERVAVMGRASDDEVTAQRVHGGQIMNLKMKDIRTRGEVLKYLRANNASVVPRDTTEWVFERTLGASALKEIWDNTK